jgi:hypothetical protein
LDKKIKKIIKDIDLTLAITYANIILNTDEYKNLKTEVPELLYDISDVYKTLELIEILEV